MTHTFAVSQVKLYDILLLLKWVKIHQSKIFFLLEHTELESIILITQTYLVLL